MRLGACSLKLTKDRSLWPAGYGFFFLWVFMSYAPAGAVLKKIHASVYHLLLTCFFLLYFGFFPTVAIRNTFILTKTLGPCAPNTSPVSMYRGSRIRELAACGLKLEACYSGWDACRLALEELGA